MELDDETILRLHRDEHGMRRGGTRPPRLDKLVAFIRTRFSNEVHVDFRERSGCAAEKVPLKLSKMRRGKILEVAPMPGRMPGAPTLVFRAHDPRCTNWQVIAWLAARIRERRASEHPLLAEAIALFLAAHSSEERDTIAAIEDGPGILRVQAEAGSPWMRFLVAGERPVFVGGHRCDVPTAAESEASAEPSLST